MRRISYAKAALKALARIPADERNLIARKIEQPAVDPASLANNVTALKGSAFARLRVGNYRVIVTADLAVVAVLKVGHRRDIYD